MTYLVIHFLLLFFMNIVMILVLM